MSQPKRCDEHGMCEALEERLTENTKGFHPIHTLDRGANPESWTLQWRGVSYHMNAKDKGLLINFCPWCGGKPGDLAKSQDAKEKS